MTARQARTAHHKAQGARQQAEHKVREAEAHLSNARAAERGAWLAVKAAELKEAVAASNKTKENKK